MNEIVSFMTLAAWLVGVLGFVRNCINWQMVGCVDMIEGLLVIVAWAWLLHHYMLFGAAR